MSGATGGPPAGGWLGLAARLVLGGAFAVLGALKLEDPVAFLKVIREYEMIPESLPWLLNLTAAALPFAEILLGVLLLAGVAVRGTAAVALLLLGVFTTGILLRALGIQAEQGAAFCSIAFDCGCGTGVVPVCRKLLENGALLVAALVVLVAGGGRAALRPELIPRRERAPRSG